MKALILVIILLFLSTSLSAQRYLNPVFTSITTYSNITYGAAINIQSQLQNLVLDFYEPSGDSVLSRPLLIYVHGGGFSDTNQTKSLAHIIAFCDSFARRGYAVASINYRLDSTNTGLSHRAIINAMHDAKAAIRFFKTYAALFKVDTNLIFIGGESAGAVTAMNAAFINQSPEVLYPLTPPFNSNLSIEGNSGSPNASSKVKAALCFCGGTKHVSTLPIFDTNAINVATDPYLLFTHGTADPLVPVQYSIEIALRASHIGLPHLYYPFYGASHCPWGIGLPNSWAYLDSLVEYTAPFLYAIINLSSTIEKKEIATPKLYCYPNPAQDYLVFSSTAVLRNPISITIYNALGEVLLQQPITDIDKRINVSALKKGIYYLHYQAEGAAVQKFIKQ